MPKLDKYWVVLFLVVLFLDGAQTHFFVTKWNIERELMPGPKLILKHLGTTGMWAIRIVVGVCLIFVFIRNRIKSIFKIVTVAELLAVIWNFVWLVSYLVEKPL